MALISETFGSGENFFPEELVNSSGHIFLIHGTTAFLLILWISLIILPHLILFISGKGSCTKLS